MSRKVFTAGEVLAAADVNSFLMDQTVMSFAGTAARGSAIPSPVTGMTTYLEDTKDLRIYDGSAYSSPFGSTLVGTAVFTSQSSVSLNNVFSSEFDNYMAFVTYSGNTGVGMGLRLRASGTDLSTSTYYWSSVISLDSTVSGSHAWPATNWEFNAVRNASTRNAVRVEFFNPAKSGVSKNYSLQASDWTGGAMVNRSTSGFNSTTTVFDGFSLVPGSGQISGEVYVYGMRK